MDFIADFHVHSKHSIATARNLDLENVYIWAQKKGITVVATGDFTHPLWIQELLEKLIPAEDGLFRLRNDIADRCDEYVPHSCKGTVRFMLISEISNIYKKNGRTRKNHNLVFIPDFSSALRFNARLDKIGNIRSDGRPILGLDARNLLEILLEVNDSSFLVPAHVWTPWFSLFGSKSGFDSIEECFEDLTTQIFAVETGLSSDPPMNWRVSGLDNLTLISNSDAHSPGNLGREATLFHTELDFFHIKEAIKTGDPNIFKGTIEFYPEEGKYHADGHRNCGLQLMPQETVACGGICPVCGKEITRGVLYRVEELADRPVGYLPEQKQPFSSIVPLPTLLSKLYQRGPRTKKVVSSYEDIIARFGPELYILCQCPIEQLKGFGHRLFAEAIDRVRNRNITLTPGYDGEYGKISIFSETEKEMLLGQKFLFDPADVPVPSRPASEMINRRQESPATEGVVHISKNIKQKATVDSVTGGSQGQLKDLNRNQRLAVTSRNRHLLIQAGPGTGKTRTLTYRIAYLIKEKKEDPTSILALTFTNKAAAEMKKRLGNLLPKSIGKPFVGTFHAFCLYMIQQQKLFSDWSIAGDQTRRDVMEDAIRMVQASGFDTTLKAVELLKYIEKAKQHLMGPNDIQCLYPDLETNEISNIYRKFQEILTLQHLMDYDDVINQFLLLLQDRARSGLLEGRPIQHIFIDEYQDLNYGQYRLLLCLQKTSEPPASICVIGDPDQSIYGFRGSDLSYFNRFCEDFPGAEIIQLKRNYRSAETIVKASVQMIRKRQSNAGDELYSGIEGIQQVTVLQVGSEKAEAVSVGKIVESMIGGTGFQFYDFRNKKEYQEFEKSDLSFSDFAVLFRTRRQGDLLFKVLTTAGIPCQIVSKKGLLLTKGISELLSLLRVVAGVGSYGDFERFATVFDPAIDSKTIALLKNWGYEKRFSLQTALLNAERFPVNDLGATKQMAVCDVRRMITRLKQRTEGMTVTEQIAFWVENTRIGTIIHKKERRRDVLKHVVDLSRHFGIRLSDFLENLSLGKDQDIYRENTEKVSLMTMHASKGLEFPIVFICGCEDGIIPFRQERRHPDNQLSPLDIAEERRLFYVAMTRAKDNLFLLHARKRLIYGQAAENKISPFIGDIDDGFLLMKKGKMGPDTKKLQIQLELF